jgi:iron-sulfur cluster repair protein YtfE (RIC family)
MPLLYQKVLSSFDLYDVVKFAKNLASLYNDTVIPHFDFEEKEIFPPALAKGEAGCQTLIQSLLDEHKEMSDKFIRIKELAQKLGSDPAAAAQKEKDNLAALCNEVCRQLTEHAQKEDEQLFPYLRNIDYK